MLLNNIGAGFRCIYSAGSDPKRETRIASSRFHLRLVSPVRSAAFDGVHWERKDDKRRSICTADELHRVSVSNSDWNLALWRYLPSPKVPKLSTLRFLWIPFWQCNDISFWVSLNFIVFIQKNKEGKKIHLEHISR